MRSATTERVEKYCTTAYSGVYTEKAEESMYCKGPPLYCVYSVRFEDLVWWGWVWYARSCAVKQTVSQGHEGREN